MSTNDKRNLERILNFPFVTAAPTPGPNSKTALVQGSMKRQPSEMEQLERLLKLGLS